jgi:hypothetical protein
MTWVLTALALARWEVWLALSVTLILVHTMEEVRGEGGPLWRYLSDVSGADIYDPAGYAAVALVTPAAMMTAVAMAYWTREPFWLGVVFGAKSGDMAFTHTLPTVSGYRPNPGIWSSLLYGTEAIGLATALELDPLGMVVGAAPFMLLWPSLYVMATVRPRELF